MNIRFIGGTMSGHAINLKNWPLVNTYHNPLLEPHGTRDEGYSLRKLRHLNIDETVFVLDGMTDDQAIASLGIEQNLIANFGDQ